jgi:hypothetical protein
VIGSTGLSGWCIRPLPWFAARALVESMKKDHLFNNKEFYGATKITGKAMAT